MYAFVKGTVVRVVMQMPQMSAEPVIRQSRILL
jgi:hypothetical protein